MDSKDNLNSFLSLGYFLDYKNPDISYDLKAIPVLKEELSQYSLEELQIKCKEIWYQTFEEVYQKGEHVVPISGGLDSRAILATLLEFTDASNISTYTFGTPKTYDYEIGNMVAKRFGTNHKSFSFNKYKFSTEKEVEVSQRIDHQTFLFHHPPLELLDQFYKDKMIWSGYIMDFIAGSYIPKNSENNIKLALDKVFLKDRYVKSINLTNSNINIPSLYTLPSGQVNKEHLSYEEQITIFNRLLKNSAPHILYKGFKYKIPVLDSKFFNFFMALGDEHRNDTNFYNIFLQREFPKAFSIPVKSKHGLQLTTSNTRLNIRKVKNKVIKSVNKYYPKLVHPHTNYMDFNYGIRSRKDLNDVIYSNIMDLKNRNIVDWIDIEDIYNSHMKKQANYADALIVLASLEIHLKAGKKI